MLYKYTAVLDINPNKYDMVKNDIEHVTDYYNLKFSSLEEMSIKEQLKFYINKHLPYNTDRVRMIELVDKL
jgi:hypothetical protein